MTYKANQDIGDYKQGDIVPDEKAIIWEQMYVISPVDKVADEKPSVEKVEEVSSIKSNKKSKK